MDQVSPVRSALAHFKVRPSYATDAATATALVAEIITDAGEGLIAVDLETTPLPSERARLADLTRRVAEAKGKVQACAKRRDAARRGADGAAEATAALALAKAELAALASGRRPRRAGRSRSAPFDGAALLALRRRRPRRRDRPAQGRLGRARAGLGAADRHAQRGVRPRLPRPARHRARRRRLHHAGRAPPQRSERDLAGDRGRQLFRPCAGQGPADLRLGRKASFPRTGHLRGGRRGRDLAARRDGAAAARRTPHGLRHSGRRHPCGGAHAIARHPAGHHGARGADRRAESRARPAGRASTPRRARRPDGRTCAERACRTTRRRSRRCSPDCWRSRSSRPGRGRRRAESSAPGGPTSPRARPPIRCSRRWSTSAGSRSSSAPMASAWRRRSRR